MFEGTLNSHVRDRRSLFITGVGVGGFWGESLDFLWEQKEGSVGSESPKGGITKNFKRVREGGGALKSAWTMPDIGGGGGHESYQ